MVGARVTAEARRTCRRCASPGPSATTSSPCRGVLGSVVRERARGERRRRESGVRDARMNWDRPARSPPSPPPPGPTSSLAVRRRRARHRSRTVCRVRSRARASSSRRSKARGAVAHHTHVKPKWRPRRRTSRYVKTREAPASGPSRREKSHDRASRSARLLRRALGLERRARVDAAPAPKRLGARRSAGGDGDQDGPRRARRAWLTTLHGPRGDRDVGAARRRGPDVRVRAPRRNSAATRRPPPAPPASIAGRAGRSARTTAWTPRPRARAFSFRKRSSSA